MNLASQAATQDLEAYVERVCEALGHPGALVTDESLVKDMLESGGDPHRRRRGGIYSTEPWEDRPGDPEVKARNEARLAHARSMLGVPVEPGDRIVAVAKALSILARS